MRVWFANRSDSEKILLLVAAITVIGALYFLLIVDPLKQANARLTTRVGAARELQLHLKQLADEVKVLGGSGGKARATLPAGASLLTVVTTNAHVSGVQKYTKKMAPVGANALSLYLDGMPYTQLADWLIKLDEQQGIEVERATIEALPVTGTVRADLTLRARL